MVQRIPLLLLAAFLLQPARAERPTAFWKVSVVDTAAGTLRAGMVVEVADGRITRVARATGARPANAVVVDGAGKFLIPGLWDSHVHLTKLGASSLPVFIANGVTSVRDMGSDLGEVLQWRRDIASSTRVGPRIKTPGQILESAANVERMKREGTVEPVDRIRVSVGSPEEARDAVTRLADGGADFLKVRTVTDEATLRAIAAAARSRGLRLTGHPVTSPDGLIDIGIDSVEHVLTFPPLDIPFAQRRALFERMRTAAVRMGTTTVNLEQSVLVPYDTAVSRLKSDPLRRYVGEYLASDWSEQVEEKKGPEAARALEDFARALPQTYRDLREMHAAGVEFLAGSDAAVVFMYPGFSLHGELDSLVHHVGLTTAEALRAATINPTRFFGLERELGAIRLGYRADLVLLESNPLNDIRATGRIAGVMHDGRWLDRHDLDALLEAAAREARGQKAP